MDLLSGLLGVKVFILVFPYLGYDCLETLVIYLQLCLMKFKFLLKMWVSSFPLKDRKRERDREINLTKFVVHWIYIYTFIFPVKDLLKLKCHHFSCLCVGSSLYSFTSWAMLYGLVMIPSNEPFATTILVASELWRSSQKTYSVLFSQTGWFGTQSSSPGFTVQQLLSPTLNPMKLP